MGFVVVLWADYVSLSYGAAMTAPMTPRDPFTDEDVQRALNATMRRAPHAAMRAALLAGTKRLRADVRKFADCPSFCSPYARLHLLQVLGEAKPIRKEPSR